MPGSSCARKETVDIDTLVSSRNGDRKIMQSIRITSRPHSRLRKWNHIVRNSSLFFVGANCVIWTLKKVFTAVFTRRKSGKRANFKTGVSKKQSTSNFPKS